MTDMSIFVDTNILVYFKTLKSPFFDKANTKLIQLYIDNELYISNQIIKEYLVTMTRLSADNNLELFLKDAYYFSEKFNFLYESKESKKILLEIIARFKVKGRQIHDANIVATMLANNIKNLFTHNVKDFERFSNLINIIELG